MKDSEVNSESTKKPQKTKEEIRKDVEEPIVNSKNHDNMEIGKKAKMVERPEDAAKVIQELEEINRTNKNDCLVALPIRYSISVV